MQPTLLPADADEYSVTRSLEAYLLWLFGYIMFNNTYGNSVDRILLPYAREIADGDEDVPPYSWGEDERPTMGTIWIWRQVRSYTSNFVIHCYMMH